MSLNWLLRAAALCPAIVLVVIACGSGGDSGGSGNDFAATAAAICARKAEGGCTVGSSYCEHELEQEHAVAMVFGCTAEHTKYSECLASSTWKCEPAGDGGAEYLYEPTACSELKAAYKECQPVCGWIGCSGSCYFDPEKIAIDCQTDAPGPISCSCASGPRAGAVFQVESCEIPTLAAGLNANCR
jgi:hypothetical protein